MGRAHALLGRASGENQLVTVAADRERQTPAPGGTGVFPQELVEAALVRARHDLGQGTQHQIRQRVAQGGWTQRYRGVLEDHDDEVVVGNIRMKKVHGPQRYPLIPPP